MRVMYDVTIDDLLAFNLHHFQHSPTIQRQVMRARIFVTVIVATSLLIFGYFANNQQGVPLSTYPITAVTMFVVYSMYPRLVRSSMQKRMTHMMNEGHNHASVGRLQLVVEPDVITETSPAGTLSINRSGVEKITETNDHIFIYTGAINAFIVPKRAFTTADDIRTFLNLVSSGYITR